jgi:hypothetical protein
MAQPFSLVKDGKHISNENPVPTSIVGSLAKDTLQEQLTETDAVAGVLTFTEPIKIVEIYNTDATNSGTFNVNGIDIVVPATDSYMSAVGGTESTQVTITGATTYIISRYVQEVN